MKSVSEIMTRNVRAMKPTDSIILAAQAMKELDVSALPVCDADKLVGIVTERDIVRRAVAEDRGDKNTSVKDVMSTGIETCYEDDSLVEILHKMEHNKIRRLPVINREKTLVGMVSLGDVAVKDGGFTDPALSEVSNPASPDLG